MNRKTVYLLLLSSLLFILSSVSFVSGAAIEEVIIFGDFDGDGNPIPQNVYTPMDDIVGLWFNLSEVSPGDNIIIEWWPPEGELYKTTNWTAPSYVEDNSDWDMWEDMEIMGDPAEDMPGLWAANIFVDGARWGDVTFELVTDGSSSNSSTDTDDDEVIRGYYVWVTDVRTVGDVVLGQNVTLEVDIEYNFMEVPLVPTILDQDFEIRGKASDTISGYGENTYTISMETRETDDTMYFAVMAYYFIDGNWTYMDPNGYMPFTLDQGEVSDDPEVVDLPDNIDFSEIDLDKYTKTLNNTLQRGLDLLDDVEVPDELSGIEDTIKERTGIPGYPVEVLILGTLLLVYLARRRI